MSERKHLCDEAGRPDKPIASWEAPCGFFGLNSAQRKALALLYRLGGVPTQHRSQEGRSAATFTSLVRRGLARRSERQMPWPTYHITADAHRLIRAITHAEGCMIEWDGKSRRPLGQERVVSCYHCNGKGRTCLGLPIEDGA